jgi:predicted Rossmann-fold nucleotide-binding protein
MHFSAPCITVFGSARSDETHKYYIAAREFGKRIAEMGFATLTGVALELWKQQIEELSKNGGDSIGCNIKLPL